MEQRNFWDEWTPRMLSVLRMVIALLFIEHGTQKLMGYPAGPGAGPYPVGTLPWTAGMIELVGGTFLLVGLFTRVFAFIMSGEMAVAYFMAHASKSPFPVINQGEPAVLFCFMFLFYVFAGAGSWSLDALMRKEAEPNTTPAPWPGTRPLRGT